MCSSPYESSYAVERVFLVSLILVTRDYHHSTLFFWDKPLHFFVVLLTTNIVGKVKAQSLKIWTWDAKNLIHPNIEF